MYCNLPGDDVGKVGHRTTKRHYTKPGMLVEEAGSDKRIWKRIRVEQDKKKNIKSRGEEKSEKVKTR